MFHKSQRFLLNCTCRMFLATVSVIPLTCRNRWIGAVFKSRPKSKWIWFRYRDYLMIKKTKVESHFLKTYNFHIIITKWGTTTATTVPTTTTTTLTDKADTLEKNFLERFFQLLLREIVLIHPDPDVFRTDFDEFGERILKPPGNRHGSNQCGLKARVLGHPLRRATEMKCNWTYFSHLSHEFMLWVVFNQIIIIRNTDKKWTDINLFMS